MASTLSASFDSMIIPLFVGNSIYAVGDDGQVYTLNIIEKKWEIIDKLCLIYNEFYFLTLATIIILYMFKHNA